MVKSDPPLTQSHKDHRLCWARQHVSWHSGDWGGVIFTDEKGFDLDGPGRLNTYWHDLWKEQKILSRQTNGGGGIMLCAGISGFGKTKLALMNGLQDSKKYVQVLEDVMLPFGDDNMPLNCICMQDSAPIHTSLFTFCF